MKQKKMNIKSLKKTMRFTLVEMLGVCAILGILASIILTAYRVVNNKNLRNRTMSIIKQMEVALESYKSKTGFYPPKPDAGTFIIDPTDTTLIECIPNYQVWVEEEIINTTDERIDSRRLLDPYGQAFWYRCPGYHNRSGFDLESSGPNKFFGYSKTSGHGVSFQTEWNRDAKTSYGVNSKHSTIYYPKRQKDNIKNWE